MRVVVGLGAVALVLFLTLRALFGGGTVSWNQRLTLVIETPQGEARGSAVTRVENVTSKGALVLAEAWGTRSYWTGEAVAVEVLPGKWLFALLEGESGTDTGHWVYAAYDLNEALAPNGHPSIEAATSKLWAQPMNVPVPLPADRMPMMVSFGDITKPETVRKVDPEGLAAVFGEGVRLKAVTLEITDEPVTEGRVGEVLGWFGPYPEPALGSATGKTTDIPFYRRVYMGDFIRRP
ncbi:hypothetical protein [Tabrizicola sp.]|uniref:hypothetical protein n=1 Tax=Tabrizicola sp. TaxID=2005166 RepID=UPI0025E170DF|nr:hypothetical protein [Tabrizicola sp.]